MCDSGHVTESDWVAMGSIAAAVTALFTAAMAVAIVVTAIYARRTLAAAKDDSRARTRPTLVAYLERELLAHGTILLVIKNFGASSATDVRVSFDPPAPAKEDIAALPESDLWKWVYRRFSDPVPVWAPGWSTDNVVRAGQDVLAPFSVVASYLGPDGTRYEDGFLLRPDHILNATSTTPTEAEGPVEIGQQAVSALHALVRTVRKR